MGAGAVPDLAQHLIRVGRVAHRGGGEREQVLDALVLSDLQRLADEGVQLLGAVVGQPTALFQVITEPQFGLV